MKSMNSMWTYLIGGGQDGHLATEGVREVSSRRALLARKLPASTRPGSLAGWIASVATRQQRRMSNIGNGNGEQGKPLLGKLLAVSDPRKDGRPAGF